MLKNPALLLSGYWLASLGALGVFFPFYALYLRENAGLLGSQVGVIMAVLPLVGMIAQPLWGHLADRTGERSRVLALLSFAAALGYAALYLASGFAALLLMTAVLALFSTAVLPMGVSVSLALLGHNARRRFGLVRVWGTVGFLLTVTGFPPLMHRYQQWRGLGPTAASAGEPGLEVMLLASALLLLLGACIALLLPRTTAVAQRASRGDWRSLLHHPPFVRVLLLVLGAFLFLQGPMALFPIYVRSLGGGVDTVSRMWVFMLLLEIPLVAMSGFIQQRIGGRGLLALGIGAGALRWLVCALTTRLALIYAVQILHGVTVMGLIIGGPLYVEAVVPARLRATGQGLLAMAGVSLGGILSNLVSGWLLEHVSATAPALLGGIGALLLTVALFRFLPPARPVEAPAVALPVAEL